VLVGWIVLLLGSSGISRAVGTNFSNNFSLKGTDSQRAIDLLQRDFPAQSGDSDQVVLHALRGRVTDPRSCRASRRSWRRSPTSRT
jgi:RND superfamily putative drug exporter